MIFDYATDSKIRISRGGDPLYSQGISAQIILPKQIIYMVFLLATFRPITSASSTIFREKFFGHVLPKRYFEIRGGSWGNVVDATATITNQIDIPNVVESVTNEKDIKQQIQNQEILLQKNYETNKSASTWRDNMPEPLRRKGPKTFQKLQLGPNCDIYLLGTAHVSKDSSADVRSLLEHVCPTCIFVELCEARIPLLEGHSSTIEHNENNLNFTSADNIGDNKTTKQNEGSKVRLRDRVKATQEAQGGSKFQAFSTVLLTSVQEDYASELGVELGGEFRCAHMYWKNCGEKMQSNNTYSKKQQLQQPYLVLGDRPLHLTLVRAWESLWWWPKLKVMLGLLYSSFRKPDKDEIRRWLESVIVEESDVLTESFQELRKHFPTLYRTIIDERDAWLAAKLVQTSRALLMAMYRLQVRSNRIAIVAIVGAGHVPGIVQRLTNQTFTENPEEVLAPLVVTRRWANDEIVQKQDIPTWVHEVTQLQQT